MRFDLYESQYDQQRRSAEDVLSSLREIEFIPEESTALPKPAFIAISKNESMERGVYDFPWLSYGKGDVRYQDHAWQYRGQS